MTCPSLVWPGIISVYTHPGALETFNGYDMLRRKEYLRRLSALDIVESYNPRFPRPLDGPPHPVELFGMDFRGQNRL